MMQSDFACDYCTRKDNCEKTSYDYGFCRYFVGIEVEPIIHCKDCKHALTNARIREGYFTCELTKTVPAEHFCSWAVRREE